MKKYFILTALFYLICVNSYAQERFLNKVFTNVTVDSVVYARGNTFAGIPQDLKIDIYQPENDVVSSRPVIIMAHGGAFLTNNSKRDSEVVAWCKAFAQRGYVCVSLQYRLGIVPDLSKLTSEFSSAVWRATLDFREATKYIKSKADIYKIDTNQIFGMGISSGAIAMLHAQMMDLPQELNAANPKIDTAGKSLVFNKELSKFSPKIKGIINLCGAIGDVAWMKNNRNFSLLNIHGDKDPTVPYKTGFFKVGSLPIASISGSFSIDSMARKLAMDSELYTFKGAGHVPFSPRSGNLLVSNAYLDSTEKLMVNFLYKRLSTNSVAVEESDNTNGFSIFPNPAKELMTIKFLEAANYQISISNVWNQTVYSGQMIGNDKYQLNVSMLDAGIYFLQLLNDKGRFVKKIVIE